MKHRPWQAPAHRPRAARGDREMWPSWESRAAAQPSDDSFRSARPSLASVASSVGEAVQLSSGWEKPCRWMPRKFPRPTQRPIGSGRGCRIPKGSGAKNPQAFWYLSMLPQIPGELRCLSDSDRFFRRREVSCQPKAGSQTRSPVRRRLQQLPRLAIPPDRRR